MSNDLIGNDILSLDHIIIWTVDHLKLHDIFNKNGFIIHSGSEHKGQGTIGSYIHFYNFYLELISVFNKEEFDYNCDSNGLKNLKMKPAWIKNKVSPFGLGLHMNDPVGSVLPFTTFNYRQEWMKDGTYLKMSATNNDFLFEPTVFIVPDYMKCRTINAEEEKDFHKHSNGSRKLASVKLLFREDMRSATISELSKFSNLQIESEDKDLIELTMDNNKNSKIIDLRKHLPLIIKY